MTDSWQGEPLSDASIVNEHEPIHYRIHDADGAGLLGFGTARPGPSGYMDIAAHYQEIQEAHPGSYLVLRRYDRPAGERFDRAVGP